MARGNYVTGTLQIFIGIFARRMMQADYCYKRLENDFDRLCHMVRRILILYGQTCYLYNIILKRSRQRKIQMRKRIYEIIEVAADNDIASKIYDVTMLIVIFLSLVPIAAKRSDGAMAIIDVAATVVFIIDYILRLTTADYKLNDHSLYDRIRIAACERSNTFNWSQLLPLA